MHTIPTQFQKQLENIPESGMGYHKVNIEYDDKQYTEQVIVNGEFWHNHDIENYNPNKFTKLW